MGTGLRTPTRVMLAVQLALLGAAIQTSTAYAQLVPSVGAASAPAVDPMERAQRQADNVMRWIKVHADKPRVAPAAPAAPTPPPAPAVTKAAPPKAVAPAPVSPEPQKVEVAAPPPVEVPVPPPVVAPAPVAPVIAPPPPPPPVEEEETPLKALAQEQPIIPRNVLASMNAPGKVMVQFKVETNGSVSNVVVLNSNRTQLNKPTLAAVANWRFEPVKTPRVAQIEFAFTP
jgi:TonB family protein